MCSVCLYIQNQHYLQYKTFLLSFEIKLQVLGHILIILKSENKNTSFWLSLKDKKIPLKAIYWYKIVLYICAIDNVLIIVSYNSVKNGSLIYCCMIVLYVYYDLYLKYYKGDTVIKHELPSSSTSPEHTLHIRSFYLKFVSENFGNVCQEITSVYFLKKSCFRDRLLILKLPYSC
jgi:hypothetical protein